MGYCRCIKEIYSQNLYALKVLPLRCRKKAKQCLAFLKGRFPIPFRGHITFSRCGSRVRMSGGFMKSRPHKARGVFVCRKGNQIEITE